MPTVQTLHNWDFVNPNGASAYGLRMKIWRPRPARGTNPTISPDWVYDGNRCPWHKPLPASPSLVSARPAPRRP